MQLASIPASPMVLGVRKPAYVDTDKVATLVLSGGEGTRLFPLTFARSKPALCYGGRHKLIDIPISNALNSGLKRIFIITQYLSNALHQHLIKTYSQQVETLSPEVKPHGKFWFGGTADAVRQNLAHLSMLSSNYFLILSGDQLYRMDLREMVQFAYETDADAVIAALPVSATDAKRMGIMQIDGNYFIKAFKEKPQTQQELHPLKLSAEQLDNFQAKGGEQEYLGSMGIYIFKKSVLIDLLHKDPREDFGKHLIPTLLKEGRIAAYIHRGYWEDIGTVHSFYQANMQLTQPAPPLDLCNEEWPIYACHHHLPGARITGSAIESSIICEGSSIEANAITHSLVGPRTVIERGSLVRHSYIMGNDSFSASHAAQGSHIGEYCILENAIIDKQVRIGAGAQLINKNKLTHYDGNGVYIRDGVILVTQGASIPNGFVL